MSATKNKNLAERIQYRLGKLGKTERGASLEAGLSDSFLRNIRQHKSGSPRIDTLERVAKVLQTTLGWLMTGEGEEERSAGFAADNSAAPQNAPLHSALIAAAAENFQKPAESRFAASFAQPQRKQSELIRLANTADNPRREPRASKNYGGFQESDEPYKAGIVPSPYPLYSAPQDKMRPADMPNAVIGKKIALTERHLPVYGQAVGGLDGEFPINGNTLYSVLCPPQLSEVSGAYAVSISGDSMYPRYEDGEIAFVDPTRRVKKGDYVIAQIMAQEGEPPLAYVKKFIRHNAGGLVLEQFNPAKELNFPHHRVVSVHYIALAGTAPA